MKSVNSDVAYDYIRKRILSAEYPPGHALMTEALSAEIGVSRTPVRDALRKLEADGLVNIQARVGASVKSMGLKEFREMCDLRLALESHAAGLAAAQHTEADRHEIQFALEAMRRLTETLAAARDEQRQLAALAREDIRFHVAIMSAAKNELMKKEILRLHLINRVVSGPAGATAPPVAEKRERDARRREVLKSHDAIGAAIFARDVRGAKQAMEQHIQEIIDNTLRTLANPETGVPARELTPEELAYNP